MGKGLIIYCDAESKIVLMYFSLIKFGIPAKEVGSQKKKTKRIRK